MRVPEAAFPLARWTERNAEKLNARIMRGTAHKHVVHPQALIEDDDGVNVPEDASPVRKLFAVRKEKKEDLQAGGPAAGADVLDRLAGVESTCKRHYEELKLGLNMCQLFLTRMAPAQNQPPHRAVAVETPPVQKRVVARRAAPRGKAAAATSSVEGRDLQTLVKKLVAEALSKHEKDVDDAKQEALKAIEWVKKERQARGDKQVKKFCNSFLNQVENDIEQSVEVTLRKDFKIRENNLRAEHRELNKGLTTHATLCHDYAERLEKLEEHCHLFRPYESAAEKLGLQIAIECRGVNLTDFWRDTRLEALSTKWPEIIWKDVYLKVLFYYLFESDTSGVGGEWELLTSAEESHVCLMIFPDDIMSMGGTTMFTQVPIDVIAWVAVNRKWVTAGDPFCCVTETSASINRWMEGEMDEATAKAFETEGLRNLWRDTVRADEFYFPIHKGQHFWMLAVNHAMKQVEIWDTLTNNRAGHEKYTRSMMKKLAPFFDKFGKGIDGTERNWCKYKVVNVHTYPEQEEGKNDCGAWMCWFLLEGLDKWRCWRSRHPKLTSQALRFRVACEILNKELWDGRLWHNMVAAAMNWAAGKEVLKEQKKVDGQEHHQEDEPAEDETPIADGLPVEDDNQYRDGEEKEVDDELDDASRLDNVVRDILMDAEIPITQDTTMAGVKRDREVADSDEKEKDSVGGEDKEDVGDEEKEDVAGDGEEDVVGEDKEDVEGEDKEDVVGEEKEDVECEDKEYVVGEEKEDAGAVEKEGEDGDENEAADVEEKLDVESEDREVVEGEEKEGDEGEEKGHVEDDANAAVESEGLGEPVDQVEDAAVSERDEDEEGVVSDADPGERA